MTTGPEPAASLYTRVDEISFRALAQYLHPFGLCPPGHAEGKNPPVSSTRPPGADLDGPGSPIWDMGDGDRDQDDD